MHKRSYAGLFALIANTATIPVCYQRRAALKFYCNSPSGSTVSIMSCQQQKQTPLLGIAPLRSRTYNKKSHASYQHLQTCT